MKWFIFFLMLFVMIQTAKSQSSESDTVWVKEIGSEVKAVKFSPDGQFIYAAAIGRKPMKLSTETGDILQEYEGLIYYNRHPTLCLDLSKDGRLLFGADQADNSNTMYIWDTETGALVHTLQTEYEEWREPYYKSITISGQYVAALVAFIKEDVTHTTETHIWDINTLEKVKVLSSYGGHTIKFSPDGRYLTYIKSSGPLLLNSETWDIFSEMTGHTDYVIDIAFSPDGSLLASGGWDGVIKIWDVNQRRLLKEFGDNYEVNSVGFIGNDKVIAGCGYFQNRYVKIWNILSENFLGQVKTNMQLDMDISTIKHFCVVANASSGVFLFDYEKIISGIVERRISNDDLIIPNPTNGICNISINLPLSGKTLVSISDANAKEIEILHKGFLEQGEHTFQWIPKDVPSGTYFCRITGTNFSKTLKIILEK